MPITVGAQQGSILAPTLFLMFFVVFVIISSLSHSDSLQQELLCSVDLEKIREWCVLSRISTNIEKSHFLVFGKPKCKICLKLGDEILTQSNNTKLLGFYLSDLMTWNKRVEKLVTKVQNNINIFQLCWSYISTFAAR